MSVNTEPMNLKDAFAYMNFLSTSMQTARDLLSPVSPRLDVRTISSDNYLYTSRKVLRYSEVNSGMEDTQEDVEDLRSYSVTGDELILFLDEARREREIVRLIGQMQIEAEADEGYVSIHFKTNPNTERGKLLMDSLILGLTEIEHSYNNRYLTVRVKEV